jgi:hypothetical protein
LENLIFPAPPPLPPEPPVTCSNFFSFSSSFPFSDFLLCGLDVGCVFFGFFLAHGFLLNGRHLHYTAFAWFPDVMSVTGWQALRRHANVADPARPLKKFDAVVIAVTARGGPRGY